MVLFYGRLYKTGINFLARRNVKSLGLQRSLKLAQRTDNVTLDWPRHFSVTKIYLCQPKFSFPQPSIKIKKEKVSDIEFQASYFKNLRNDNSYHTVKPLTSEDDIKTLLKTPLVELSDNELPIYISALICNGEMTIQLRKLIDEECASRLSKLTTENLLKLVDAWLYIKPHILNNLLFFGKAMPMFEDILSSRHTSPSTFAQTSFYLTLSAKKELSKEIMAKGLERLQQSHSLIRALSLNDLVFISIAAFRTSNAISSVALMRTISDCIKTNLETLIEDDASLITLIKPLRPAEFYDIKLMDEIAAHISTLKSKNFVSKTQIFALFGQSLYPDKKFLQEFADIIGSDLLYLLENKETKVIRIKDVSRFLWCLSYLGVVPNVKNLDKELMEKIDDWIEGAYFNASNIFWLVSMMCSIYIFNWDYSNLFKKVFHTFPPNALNVPNHPKNLRNLSLLIAGLRIEAPHLVSEDLLAVLRPTRTPLLLNHLRSRPLMRNAEKTAWFLTRIYNLTDIKCHFNVPHVLILGMTFYTPKRNLINIEILDSTNCLLTSNIPHGLMSLKLRLLKHTQQHVVLIDSTKLGKDNGFLQLFRSKIDEIDGTD